jgi:hypothetical protein
MDLQEIKEAFARLIKTSVDINNLPEGYKVRVPNFFLKHKKYQLCFYPKKPCVLDKFLEGRVEWKCREKFCAAFKVAVIFDRRSFKYKKEWICETIPEDWTLIDYEIYRLCKIPVEVETVEFLDIEKDRHS